MTNLLKPGDKAPIFQSIDQHGAPVSLDQFRSRKVLLSFFRNAACAMCNLRVHQMIQRYPEWQRQGLQIITFFESPEANLHKYVGTQQAPFPLIADPGAVVYNRYGVESSESKTDATLALPNVHQLADEAAAAGFPLTPEEGANFHRIPAEFLIDEEGIVKTAYYGKLITDHLPFEWVDRFAASSPDEVLIETENRSR
ncbi:peroxiredoxin [Paenibacillus sp. XY044]|uniref:peroxiredoxin family protein n=1 Tax=Paenibacillus sp. XY044 TaxID=2026089 RepID=UPI000B97E5F5|nr:redoxin domain-containing protein [Paenibacillus sp. XY044]OZB98398.1 hypothetical protein CJP46_04375 [Paenibacillus sp. XY044]